MLLPFCASAQTQSGVQTTNVVDTNAAAAPSTNYSIVSLGPNHRVWRQAVPVSTNQQGQLAYRTNSYTELATGLYHQVGTNWVESSENIQITPNGGVATNGQHQVGFAANINTSNAVEIITPDGKELGTHILGLSYFDAATGSNVLIAQLQDSIGQLVTSNRVVYPNAFSNLNADVRYTYRKADFEQDIIVREQLVSPATFGLSPRTTYLQVWTEFLNPPTPQITSVSDGSDVVVDFGTMRMYEGRAFIMGDESDSTPVSKQWVTLQGRTFLIEQVPFNAVAAALQALPPSGGGTGSNGTQLIQYKNFPHQLPPPPSLARRADEPLKLASSSSAPEAGLVLDYVAMNTLITNFTFQGDTTYYISSSCRCFSNTVIEGGTVIKFLANCVGLGIYGPLSFKTRPYQPAIFTSADDNTVGSTISGSSGNPSTMSTTEYLFLNFTNISSVTNVRMAYAYQGIYGSSFASSGLTISDSQFVQCNQSLRFGNAGLTNFYLHNDLFAGGAISIWPQSGQSVSADQLTSDTTNFWSNGVATPSFYLTNCIIQGAFNTNVAYLSTNSTVINPGGTIFQSFGAANYYLADSSPYRNAGTTNISPVMLAELPQKTTYPPFWLTNTISLNTILYPQAQRDSDTPDLGYHYDPIDYLSSCVVTNVALILSNGVDIGYYNSAGIWLQNGSALVSQGTPTARNVLAYYNLVQEQPAYILGVSNSIANAMAIKTLHTNSSQNPLVSLRLTSQFSPVSATYSFYEDTNTWSITNLTLQDCEVYAAGSYFELFNWTNATVTLANNVIQYGNEWVSAWGPFTAYNNLFTANANYFTEFDNNGIGLVTNFDNVYDGCGVFIGGSGGHNGYLNLDTNNVLSTIYASDIVTNLTWVAGPLGNYYQPTNSPLINKGSRTADLAGLYHYTTQVSQVKETNSIVDIGYHYVALDLTGVPVDTDGDGIPDYLEDANGNGTVDSGETDWQSATDLGLRVIITKPAANSVIP